MLLAGLFGLVTTVASALPGGPAGAPESSATASLPGQDCAAHCAQRTAQERAFSQARAARERAAQRSEALKAGAALFHRYYAAVLSRHEAGQVVVTARPEASVVQVAAAPRPAEAPVLSAGRPVRPTHGHRSPAARVGGETDPVRGPPSGTDL